MSYSLRRSFLSLFLAYIVVVSLCLPSSMPPVVASSNATPRNSRGIPFNSGKRVRVTAQATPRSGRRDGEFLVRFRRGTSLEDQRNLAASVGVRELKPLRGKSRVVRMILSSTQTIESVAVALQNHYLIESAEPNYLIYQDNVSTSETRALRPQLPP